MIGVFVAVLLPQSLLKTTFGIFLLLVAMRMLRDSSNTSKRNVQFQSVNPALGVVIGAVSSLMGVGGGTMMVPYLAWQGVDMRNAIACSAVLGLPIALSATLAFYLADFFEEAANGYVHWPALVGIVMAAVVFAPLGAKCVYYLPVKLLKKLFAIFLAIVAMSVIFVSL